MMFLVISLMRLLRWGAAIPSIQEILQQRFCLCVVELLDKLYSHQFLGEEVVCFNLWEMWLKPVSCIQSLLKFCEIMSHMKGIIDYCRCSTWFQRHKESCMPSMAFSCSILHEVSHIHFTRSMSGADKFLQTENIERQLLGESFLVHKFQLSWSDQMWIYLISSIE